MVFFKIKHCQTEELEKSILLDLKKRSIPAGRDAELFSQCSSERFLEKYHSRPFTRFKVLANRLPSWVYAILKIFPFYQVMRERLKLPVAKK